MQESLTFWWSQFIDVFFILVFTSHFKYGYLTQHYQDPHLCALLRAFILSEVFVIFIFIMWCVCAHTHRPHTEVRSHTHTHRGQATYMEVGERLSRVDSFFPLGPGGRTLIDRLAQQAPYSLSHLKGPLSDVFLWWEQRSKCTVSHVEENVSFAKEFSSTIYCKLACSLRLFLTSLSCVQILFK